jgi:hypothetical protein
MPPLQTDSRTATLLALPVLKLHLNDVTWRCTVCRAQIICAEWQHSYLELRQLSRYGDWATGWTIRRRISGNSEILIFVFSETPSCSAAQSVWHSMGDGSYFSQVKRSEREADHSAVPSIEFTCQWRQIATQLTAVPTNPLHPVIDQLSVSPSLSSDATVATGNLQSIAPQWRNAVDTSVHRNCKNITINIHPLLPSQTVCHSTTYSYVLSLRQLCGAATAQCVCVQEPNAHMSPSKWESKLCRSSIDSDIITFVFN